MLEISGLAWELTSGLVLVLLAVDLIRATGRTEQPGRSPGPAGERAAETPPDRPARTPAVPPPALCQGLGWAAGGQSR